MFDLDHDPVRAARSLLGATLRHGEVAVRITEVEAYDGDTDEASHTFRGPTPRNQVMFGPPGRLYVYFSYGMHFAANVSCCPVGHGAGVLLRSGQVIDGAVEAQARRGERVVERDLARGPGRLTQALGINAEHNGAEVISVTEVDGPPIMITPAEVDVGAISCGPRVGISRSVDLPWRFWISDDPYVSVFRPGKPRRPSAR